MGGVGASVFELGSIVPPHTYKKTYVVVMIATEPLRGTIHEYHLETSKTMLAALHRHA